MRSHDYIRQRCSSFYIKNDKNDKNDGLKKNNNAAWKIA